MIDISIIVTCYNRENTIRECLQSIENQTFKNFEVIIVDDGSTDSSKNIIKEFCQNDTRFKLIESTHVGFPIAKNIGLDNSNGEYIIFLDSDDTAYSYWLEILFNISKISNAPIVTCFYDTYEHTKAKEMPLDKILNMGIPIFEFSFLKMLLIFHNSCSSFMWNKLIKRELYNGIRHKDQIALSDVSVMYKIFEKADTVIQTRLPLIHYRIHDDSMSKTTRKGLDYYKFRLEVFKERSIYIYNKYPQARYIIQETLKKELYIFKKELGEDINKLDISDILFILNDNPPKIIL